MAQLIWAPRALDELEHLIDYISRSAPATARRFAQKIIVRVESLKGQPLSGSFIPEEETRTYRQLIQGNYRVIGRVEEATVAVVAVHVRRERFVVPAGESPVPATVVPAG